jgi:hypothetical protein
MALKCCGKGTHTRALCQKNEGSVEIKQRPIKISGRTIYMSLPPKMTPFKTKGLILGPSARRTKDLLKLNRDQLRLVVGLYTGHCHLKGHLLKLGLIDYPTCVRCLQKDEPATHILCDCEAIAYLRFRHLGQFLMEPSDYYDATINNVLHFTRSVGLTKS